MASACVNKNVMSPDKFVDCSDSFPSYGRFNPALSSSSSFVRDFSLDRSVVVKDGGDLMMSATPEESVHTMHDSVNDEDQDVFDFEFRLNDDEPVTMLPADELFFDGKLVPTMRPVLTVSTASSPGNRSPETVKSLRRIEVSGTKAPRCSTKWKEFLGLRKMYQNSVSNKQDHHSRETSSETAKSFKHFLHRNSRASHSSSSSSDSLLSHPLLKDLDSESVMISSRLSLSSSSSSGREQHDDLPRLSLDTEKPNLHPVFLLRNTAASNMNQNPPRVRLVKPRPVNTTGVSIDSPRMNPSGKVVFQNLERSSSSPGSFNGGPRLKHKGMESSYSANVRVTPLLNVPVYSLGGSSKSGGVFGLFSAPTKKEGSSGGSNRNQQSSSNRKQINRT